MLTKEQKTLISIIIGIICTVTSVCLYGFTVGGDFISFSYISYCLLTAFMMTSLAFLFIFGKEQVKKLLFKELYVIIVLIVAALQLIIYQPLNLLTAEDKGTEYEVEITDTFHKTNEVFFTDREGIPRETIFHRFFTYEDEFWPEAGGRMIVKETLGGFDCKHFEIVKVTYEPEVFY